VKAIARRLRQLEHSFGAVDGKPRVCFRLFVGPVGGMYGLDGATCRRTLCANGLLMELVIAGNDEGITAGGDLLTVANEELESFVQGFPVEDATTRKN
jgi:hypothetical protein